MTDKPKFTVGDYDFCSECGAIVTATKIIHYQMPDKEGRFLNVEKGVYNCGHDDPTFPARSQSYSYHIYPWR